jgi:uncharacterized protein YndB with AHSA1/START domain
MIEVIRERRIDASPEEIWRLVEGTERLPEWFVFAERADLLGGNGVGRRQRLHGRWGKTPYEIDQVVTDYEPNRMVAWRHEAERFGEKTPPRFARETRFAIRLVPESAGTLVRLESRQEPMNALKGLVIRLFGARQIAGQMERSLERLAGAATRARAGA